MGPDKRHSACPTSNLVPVPGPPFDADAGVERLEDVVEPARAAQDGRFPAHHMGHGAQRLRDQGRAQIAAAHVLAQGPADHVVYRLVHARLHGGMVAARTPLAKRACPAAR